MGEITLLGYICERCNHKWFPRANSEHKPFVCPLCKSPYWNIPRKNKKSKNYKSHTKKEKVIYNE